MEYQKMICLLESKTNPPSKFSTKHWGEINDDAHQTIAQNPKPAWPGDERGKYDTRNI